MSDHDSHSTPPPKAPTSPLLPISNPDDTYPPTWLFHLPPYSPPPRSQLPPAPGDSYDYYAMSRQVTINSMLTLPNRGAYRERALEFREKVRRACGDDPKVRYSALKTHRQLAGKDPSDLFEEDYFPTHPLGHSRAAELRKKYGNTPKLVPTVDVKHAHAETKVPNVATIPNVATMASSTNIRERSSIRKAFDDILGGTIGGIALVFVGHPLDTLKVRLQTQPSPPIYNGLLDCFRKTVQMEGFTGLYKGVASPLAGQAIFNAWQFFVYGGTQRYYTPATAKPGDRLTIPQYFKIGMITGFFVAFVEAPIDLFKSQVQVQIFKQKPLFTNVTSAVRHIMNEGGIRGMYQGLSATIVRNIPSVSFYFGFYEMTRNSLTAKGKKVEDLSASKLLLAGGVGGILYWALNYPCDVIKSTMQTDSVRKSERKYPTIIETAKKLYEQGGWKRFYRGYTPCLIRSVPANAACFYFYEKTKEALSTF